MLGWIYAKNIQILLWAEDIAQKPYYLLFLAITIAVCQIQMILTLIPLQNQHVGMGIRVKHTIFILTEDIAQKPSLFVIFGYNNCSVSNPNDFNIHTFSKSTCWVRYMRKMYKFYSELKILLKNLQCFWL